MSGPQGFYGWDGPSDDTSPYNATEFQIKQALRRLRTGGPVKIVAVHGGGVGAAPTVDVMPLVNQVDGQGNQTPHGIIFSIPCTRNQGGGNAIINDPKVGDIGQVHVSDRDISAVKANAGTQSNPGSRRTHSLADSVYVGAILNPANPTQAVQFTTTGIKLFGAGGAIVELNGADVHITGNLFVSGDVTAGSGGGDSVTLQNHVHSGVIPGSGDTAPPVAGT